MGQRKLPRILKRSEAARSRLFRVEALDLEFSNGTQVAYERLMSAGLGAVIIVPVQKDGIVLLVREYAAGLHAYELGLPKGRLEAGESPEAGCNRELKEEVGCGANDIRLLRDLSLAPAYMAHRTHVMLARDLYPERLPGDEPEDIEVVPWPLSDIDSLVQREDVSEGRTIAALYLARNVVEKEKNGN